MRAGGRLDGRRNVEESVTELVRRARATPAMKLLRLPGVYRPQADTWLLASVARELTDGRHVLDLCTGTGAVAIAAAQAGARSVTATDLSLRSVMTARANAMLRGLPLRVYGGDLFVPVSSERFDLVLANPPYVPSATDHLPRHTAGRCWDAGADGRLLIDRICRQTARMLAPGGAILLAHSTLCGEQRTLQLLRESGLTPSIMARQTLPFGPVMSSRAAMLEAEGIIEPGQRHEELVVIGGWATDDSPQR
jgi:release factor glutamine methyltransferase